MGTLLSHHRLLSVSSFCYRKCKDWFWILDNKNRGASWTDLSPPNSAQPDKWVGFEQLKLGLGLELGSDFMNLTENWVGLGLGRVFGQSSLGWTRFYLTFLLISLNHMVFLNFPEGPYHLTTVNRWRRDDWLRTRITRWLDLDSGNTDQTTDSLLSLRAKPNRSSIHSVYYYLGHFIIYDYSFCYLLFWKGSSWRS